MLQAATGKLFTERLNAQVNMLRGEMYSNLDFGDVDSIRCAAGSLTAGSSEHNPRTMCYEVQEPAPKTSVHMSPIALSSSVIVVGGMIRYQPSTSV